MGEGSVSARLEVRLVDANGVHNNVFLTNTLRRLSTKCDDMRNFRVIEKESSVQSCRKGSGYRLNLI